jgi:hypothetical protein
MQAGECESTLKKEGFDEILTKALPANMNNDVHEHDWDVRTLVRPGIQDAGRLQAPGIRGTGGSEVHRWPQAQEVT